MDVNECNTSPLDADVRLPPRKRLLAGLKRKSCSDSTSQCSQENTPSPRPSPTPTASPNPSPIPIPSPSPSFSATCLSEFDIRLNNLLKTYKNGSNMSPEEIAKAATSAAEAAAKAAQAARSSAEEKAAIAAKKVSSAKSALDLVASSSDDNGIKDKYLKKNKLKKHVPVQLLYKKYQPVENCGADEELARKLHRAINSSPRITKHSPGSDSKDHKHKKLKISPPSEKSSKDESPKLPSACNGDVNHVIEGGMDCEGSNEEPFTVKVDDKVSKSTKSYEVEVNSIEAESSHSNSKEKPCEIQDDVCVNGRKRGRIKQKKLPLSICSSKDQTNPKDDQNPKNSLIRARPEKPISRHVSLISREPPTETVTPIEVPPTWKCQDFKVSQCIKQDKVVQS